MNFQIEDEVAIELISENKDLLNKYMKYVRGFMADEANKGRLPRPHVFMLSHRCIDKAWEKVQKEL